MSWIPLLSAWCSVLVALAARPLNAQQVLLVPGDSATIQEAIRLARDGDTVRVAPGTYHEALDLLGKAITLASEAGAAATIVDATGTFESVVTMHSGEGPGTILRGFTLTGGNSSSFAGGISGFDGHPATTAAARIEACIVRGNRSSNGWAGGITGNATVEDCLIEDNSSLYAAGGIAGAPVVRRCTIRNNTGYDGGGAYLFGGRIEDSILRGNRALEGTRGGGVYLAGAETLLLRCQVSGNHAIATGFNAVSSAGIYAPDGTSPVLVVNCTVVDNRMTRPGPIAFDDCGGLRGPVRLINSIVRGNDGTQVIGRGAFQVLDSDVQGGFPGIRNFDLDPLFVDAAAGDYRLRAGSPCIDRGAPTSPLDPDCTRADVGALYFAQPCVQVDGGSGGNGLVLASLSPPALGSTWRLRVDATPLPGALVTTLAVYDGELSPGVPTPWGELLVGGTLLFQQSLVSSGGFDDFSLLLPPDPALLGAAAFLQAVVWSPASARLTNALDVKLGH